MIEKALTEVRAISGRLEAAGGIASRLAGDLLISKQKLRQAESIRLVRMNREREAPNLGFAARPFVLCGLPIKRPAKGVLLHERVTGSSSCRLLATRRRGCLGADDQSFSSEMSARRMVINHGEASGL